MVATFAMKAAAREASVVLLRPAHPSAQAAEAIVRLRGELLAAGYAVELADVPEHGSVRAAMEPPARPAGADAMVALFGDLPQGPGLLWVIDRTTGKTVTRPIPHDTEGDRAAQILSVRALELLRASFLEAALAPAAAPAPPRPPTAPVTSARPPVAVPAPTSSAAAEAARTAAPADRRTTDEAAAPAAAPREAETTGPAVSPPAVRRAATPPARAPTRLALEAGGLLLGSLDGMPPAALPLLRATLLPVQRWPLFARLTVAGLGTRARVNGAQGDAEVSHQLAIAEVLWAFRPGRRWQPFVSLGAGATHVSAQGVALSGGAAGRAASTWAFVADAGAGLHVALGQRLYLAGEVHVEADAPYPEVRYLGQTLATEGRPTLVGALSLIAWL